MELMSYRQDQLCDLWRFFAWIDKNRFSPDNENSWIELLSNAVEKAWEGCGSEFRDFEPRAFILAHWLTYVMDYQMPAETVWNRAFPIIYHMAEEYVENRVDPGQIENGEAYLKEIDGRLYLVLSSCGNVRFRHRFMEKKLGELGAKRGQKIVRSILRTLKILDGLDHARRDLAGLMVRLSEYGAEDWVRRVAAGLHILTYEHSLDIGEAIEILSRKDMFNKYFGETYGYGTNKIQSWLWHKRTWAALRDYLKGEIHRNFVKPYVENSSFSEEAKEKWREPREYLYQLELPGDIWNEKFYSIIRSNVESLFNKNIPKSVLDSAPKAIRLLYEHMGKEGCREKPEAALGPVYPEQFDATYDYANLCINRLCKICPLYTDRLNSLVRRVCRPAEDVYCPFLLLLGYIVRCDPSKCLLNKELEKIPRICDGWYSIST